MTERSLEERAKRAAWYREYYAKNRERIRAQKQRQHRVDTQRRAVRAYEERRKSRGALGSSQRLGVPRTLGRWAGRLRWRRPRSSNGDWHPASPWEAVMVYGGSRYARLRERRLDREDGASIGARWLRSHGG